MTDQVVDQELTPQELTSLKKRQRMKAMAQFMGFAFLLTLLWCGANAISILRIQLPTYSLEVDHTLPPGESPAYALSVEWEALSGGLKGSRPQFLLDGFGVVPSSDSKNPSPLILSLNQKHTLSPRLQRGVAPGLHKGNLVLARSSGAQDLPARREVPISMEVTPWLLHWWPSLIWVTGFAFFYLLVYLFCVFTYPVPRGTLQSYTPEGTRRPDVQLRRQPNSWLFPWNRSDLDLISLLNGHLRGKATLDFRHQTPTIWFQRGSGTVFMCSNDLVDSPEQIKPASWLPTRMVHQISREYWFTTQDKSVVFRFIKI